MLAVFWGLLGCQDQPSLEDARAVVRRAKIQEYRDRIPDFARARCAARVPPGEDPPPDCLEAVATLFEAVADRIERVDPALERSAHAIGTVCMQRALRASQSDDESTAAIDHFVDALRGGPACVEEYYQMLVRGEWQPFAR